MIPKDIKFLAVAFFFIFFGYNGVQQYVTTYFGKIGKVDIGLNSLILVYLGVLIFYIPSTFLILRLGLKKSLIFGTVAYSLFIFSLLSGQAHLIYLAAIFLGFSAALLWTSQSIYLLRTSDSRFYGANSGFFQTIFQLGSALGIFLFGLLLYLFEMKNLILIFGLIPLFSFLFFWRMEEVKIPPKENPILTFRKIISHPSVLRLSSLSFVGTFILGLSFGFLPKEISKFFAPVFVSFLVMPLRTFPIFFSYFFGRLSDRRGRKKLLLIAYLIIILGFFLLLPAARPIFLVLSIFILAAGFSLMKPLISPLIGDIGDHKNLEFVNLAFSLASGVGVLTALFVSKVFYGEAQLVFLISIGVALASLLLVLPPLRLKIEDLRNKIS